jgi:hypothetical protein
LLGEAAAAQDSGGNEWSMAEDLLQKTAKATSANMRGVTPLLVLCAI